MRHRRARSQHWASICQLVIAELHELICLPKLQVLDIVRLRSDSKLELLGAFLLRLGAVGLRAVLDAGIAVMRGILVGSRLLLVVLRRVKADCVGLGRVIQFLLVLRAGATVLQNLAFLA